MKAEYTAQIKRVGNSYCVLIPKAQMTILKAQERDVVKVVIDRIGKGE